MTETGLNSEVEHRGQVFHVQTESIERSTPVVQTLIYSGGEILVRMTAPLADVAELANLGDDDIEHALRIQHWGLIRKIQCGMLADENDAPAVPDVEPEPVPEPQLVTRVTPADLARCAEPSVGDLLAELNHRIGEIKSSLDEERPAAALKPKPVRQRHWWERYTGRVSVVVRW